MKKRIIAIVLLSIIFSAFGAVSCGGSLDSECSDFSENSRASDSFDESQDSFADASENTDASSIYCDSDSVSDFVSESSAESSEAFYILSFETNGGNVLDSQSYKSGEALECPPPPYRKGFVFVGWFSDFETTEAFEFLNAAMPPSDMTLYAKWRELQKNITINLHINCTDRFIDFSLPVRQNEGEELDETGVEEAFALAMEAELKFLNDSVDLIRCPVYRLVGWAFDSEGEKPFGGTISFSENGRTELYALWERSDLYVKITVLPSKPAVNSDTWFALKNRTLSRSAVTALVERLDEMYQPFGYRTNGFMTQNGGKFDFDRAPLSDTKLFPSLLSLT